jgi:hypothetical protein
MFTDFSLLADDDSNRVWQLRRFGAFLMDIASEQKSNIMSDIRMIKSKK